MTEIFFLGGLHNLLEKSVRIHNLKNIQGSIRLASSHDDILQKLEKKMSKTKQS